MLKCNNLNIIFIVLFLFCVSCFEKKEKVVPVQENWSSIEPLDIPLRQRTQIYETGNLVINPSFEEGKVLLDSLRATFNIKGWKKMGDHIQWVDTASENYSLNEVSDGRYAIKIHREKSSEKEKQGEGVLSDYIKVIPGKYKLSLDIKLKEIKSNLNRLGNRIFDAVYIKIYYFDKNKIEIEQKDYFLAENENIDYSFKGFPFSHFPKIDSIDWINLICRSHYSPYFEGFIPNEARYVKLYFGLKGTGTMWIDNVDFRYTRKNFSMLERIRPLFDSTYTTYDLLVPTPKFVKEGMPINYFPADSAGKHYPYIIIPPNSKKTTIIAAQILRSKLDSIFYSNDTNYYDNNDGVKIITSMNNSIANSGSVFFSIGNTILFQMYKQGLPYDKISSKEDGYFIKQIDDNQNVIYLAGNNDRGNLFAVYTALQLFDKDDYIFYNAEIIDYPDFEKRSLVIKESDFNKNINLDNIFYFISGLKFNNIYLQDDENTETWYLYDKNYINCLNKLKKYSIVYSTDFGVMINPYSHLSRSQPLDSLDEKISNKWTHSNSNSVSLLKYKINYAIERGANSICILSNKYLPYIDNQYNYVLYNKNDIEKYYNLAIAQLSILNSINHYINLKNKPIAVEFLPPLYNNYQINMSKGKAEYYFNNFTSFANENINFLWTGYDFNSYYIDKVDLLRYSQLINKMPVYLDNYFAKQEEVKDTINDFILSNYPKKILLTDIFDTYNLDLPDDLYSYINESKYILNLFPYNEIESVKTSMMAEYLWNSAEFNPDEILWKILNARYGSKLAKELVYFNKYYTQIEELYYKSKLFGFEKKDERHFESIHKQISNSLLRISIYPNGKEVYQYLTEIKDSLVRKIPGGVD
ncbi:MAG: hypothetical protein JXB17_00045 [Bacteroidales bacterium]|nr:hypothetical protein [Bacteroidales bacterium]